MFWPAAIISWADQQNFYERTNKGIEKIVYFCVDFACATFGPLHHVFIQLTIGFPSGDYWKGWDAQPHIEDRKPIGFTMAIPSLTYVI
jgi:hypothetical protein